MTKSARKRLITKARRYRGVNHVGYVIDACEKAPHVPIALGLALLEQESGFRNVFGHDAGGPFPGQHVTHEKVLRLLEHVDAGGNSNGVGPVQLTYPPLIREAQRRGGAHKPGVSIAVGIAHLNDLIGSMGKVRGIAAYNDGTGRSATGLAYSASVRYRAWRWHRRLWKKKK
jgi:hypothetical protein